MKLALRFLASVLLLCLCTTLYAAGFSFLDLSVKQNGTQQKLSWWVQNETAIVRYEVERSDNYGTSYQKIGEVAAAAKGQYDFSDATSLQIAFYRIKSIDNTNKTTTITAYYEARELNIFTGTGNWYDNARWSKGKPPSEGPLGSIPPLSMDPPQTAVISGICTYSPSGLIDLFVPVEVSVGGTLTIQRTNNSDSIRIPEIIIKGQLTNENNLLPTQGISIEENASLTNTKSIKMNYVGRNILTNKGAFTNSGTFIGKVVNIGPGTAVNKGVIMGNTTVEGNVTNEGTLAPGNSPGTVTITGDYTATTAAVHTFEIGGNSTGLYDLLTTNGAVNLNGNLTVSLINSYTPSRMDNISIITGTINGRFASATIPATYTLVYTSNSVSLQGPDVLPVTFTGVVLQKEASGVKVIWNVADEQGIDRYEVQRSSDGRSYQLIGSVKSNAARQYTFLDEQPLASSLYRVKSIDADGKLKYSIFLRYEKGTTSIRLAATPAVISSQLLVQHNTATPNSTLRIISLSGQQVLAIQPTPGEQQSMVDVQRLMVGTYILEYQNNKGEKETIRFVKQ